MAREAGAAFGMVAAYTSSIVVHPYTKTNRSGNVSDNYRDGRRSMNDVGSTGMRLDSALRDTL